MKSLGEFLRSNRKRLGFTQDAVAEKLNIVTPVLSKWENDKRVPDLTALCKLCNVFGIGISDCINLENSANPVLPPEEYNAVLLGNTIKRLRQTNGWTQSEVGSKLFVTSQTVSKWESGGVATLELLQQISTLYAVSPEALLCGLASTPIVKPAPVESPTTTKTANKKRVIVSVVAVILSLFIVFCAVLTAILLKSCDTQDNQGGTNQTPNYGNGVDSTTSVLPIGDYIEIYNNYGQYKDGIYMTCLDFIAPAGTEVYSVAAGTVNFIAFNYDYHAHYLVIEHGDGILTIYRNIRTNIEDITLSVGDTVEAGQIIGEIAPNPNRSCGVSDDHLCFTMTIDGTHVNPADYLPINT